MTDRICRITIDDQDLAPPTPAIEQERRVAIFDLLEENSFRLPADTEGRGPYALTLAIRDRRLVFDIADEAGAALGAFHLSLTPFRQVVKDYFQICESYFDAVKTMPLEVSYPRRKTIPFGHKKATWACLRMVLSC